MKILISTFLLCLFSSTGFSQQIFVSDIQQTKVLELFSTQGCSSCPPAQAFVSRLKTNKGLWKSFIPLVFHVDYWDYLGWKDPYAQKRYSLRQRRYVSELGLNGGYTPMFVLNRYTGSSLSLAKIKERGAEVGVLRVKKQDKNYHVEFKPKGDQGNGFKLNYAFIANNVATKVTAGENKGELLRHDFLVLESGVETFAKIKKTYSFNGKIEEPKFPKSTSRAIVFWVTRVNSQVPIQATGGYYKD
ncbi:MAG: DUF1223 domain-containing protein [Bdellovibrionales bacterium]|nr:DUF1223 domain-containing protein [Bdellovibrionales bacterium]